jgi:excisionase family DNA binding protein
VKLDQSRLEYYITPEQAAKQLGLDLDSIYQLADEGKLQAAANRILTTGSTIQSMNKPYFVMRPILGD